MYENSLIIYIYLLTSLLDSVVHCVESSNSAADGIYYLCGVYPNQYYSTKPCYYTETKCANGGDMLNTGCVNEWQCAPYYNGKTACINGCCCTVPNDTTPMPSHEFGYCYNGQLSQVRCSAYGQCASDQICMNGLCCTHTGLEYQFACGGVSALGNCFDGQCGQEAYCTPSNYCCECPIGRSGGRCNQGICPNGFTCMPNGQCCAACPNDATPFGSCRDGVCGGGTSCTAGNICC